MSASLKIHFRFSIRHSRNFEELVEIGSTALNFDIQEFTDHLFANIKVPINCRKCGKKYIIQRNRWINK